MKKILFSLLAVLFISINTNAQRKMYIWKPEVKNYVPTGVLNGLHVNLEIKDHRVIAPDSEIKATFAQISDAIRAAIMMTYGEEFINTKSDITVVLELKSFDVQFYTGMWHAQTKYIVKINNSEKELEQTNNTFNTLGKTSAKRVLTKCFTGANMLLFDYLNSELLKINNNGNS